MNLIPKYLVACLLLWLAPSLGWAIDYQKVVDQQSWRFNWLAANLLYCVDRDLRDYDVEIHCPKRNLAGDNRLTIRLLRNGKEVLRFRGYPDTVFARSGDVLYLAVFNPFTSGCAVQATDLKTGKQVWQSYLQGIGPISHSRYRNHVTIDAEGEVLVVRGYESLGRYIEYIDQKTGKTVAHKVYPSDEAEHQVFLEGIQVLKILDAQTVFLRADRTNLQPIHKDGGTGPPAYSIDGITEYTMLKVKVGEACLIRGKNRFDEFRLVKIESGKAVFHHTGVRNNTKIDQTLAVAPYEHGFWKPDPKDPSRVTYTQFDPQGRKRVEKHYHAGKLEGAWIQWYDNGHKEFEYHYVNDERDGPSIEWYPTGQKRHEVRYRNGRMVGRELYWQPHGSIAGTGDHPE